MAFEKTENPLSRPLIPLICLLAVPLALTAEDPDEFTWSNDEGGVFGVAGNWDPATVPGVDDIALFSLDESYTVEFGANTTTLGASFSAGNVTFDLNNPGNGSFTYEVSGVDGFSINGSTGTSLTVLGGTLLASNNQAYIGSASGEYGAITISGAGARLETPSTLRLGTGGNATGLMTIENGGVVTSDRDNFTIAAQVGGNTNSTAHVIVRDPGSQWILDHDMQHSRGEVTFEISNGGQIIHDGGGASLSHRSNNFTGVVSGDGSLWRTGHLVTGSNAQNNDRTAWITVEDGGRIESTRATLGNAGWMRTYVVVTGEDSEWEVTDGSFGMRLGGPEGTTNLNRYARVNVVDDGVISTTMMQILPGSWLSGDSQVVITVAENSVFNRGGLIAAGIVEDAELGLTNAIGTLTIAGNYTSESITVDETEFLATIRTRIDASKNNDQFQVLGDIELSGILEVVALGSPTLAAEDSFKILDWTGDLTGSFDAYALFDPGTGLDWDLSNLYIDGTISVIPEPRVYALLFALTAGILTIRRRLKE